MIDELPLNESQLTAIIKEALSRYASKPFGRAVFVEKPNGIEVEFHDEGVARQGAEEEPDPYAASQKMATDWAFGSGGNPFGGGSSGGGGASGGW